MFSVILFPLKIFTSSVDIFEALAKECLEIRINFIVVTVQLFGSLVQLNRHMCPTCVM